MEEGRRISEREGGERGGKLTRVGELEERGEM